MMVWRPAGGLSLAELLVSLAVLGLVLAGLFGILHSGVKAYGWGVGRVEAQQAARVALERMARELREAGYDPRGAGIQPVVAAAPALVTFQRDLNGNGVVDPTRERVTFLVRAGESVLRRDAARVRSVLIRLEVGLAGPVAVMETQVSVRNNR